MGGLTRIMGVGGGAIGGTMLAIAAGPRVTFLVLCATCVSSVLGGLMPIVGMYAGLGAALGFLCTVLLALRAEDTWTAFTVVSVLFGLTHTAIRECVLRSRRDAHTTVAPRDTAAIGRNPLSTGSGKMIVLVGAITGSVLGILLSALLKSPFFWHCVALGVFVSMSLLVGARIAAWDERKREGRKGSRKG